MSLVLCGTRKAEGKPGKGQRGSQMVEGPGCQIKGSEWFPHHPYWAIMGLE